MVAALLEGIDGPVLDVGGLPGRLTAWLDAPEVVTANVEPPADVIFDGQRLPFEDGSFEAATSVDVLEHIEPGERSRHVLEVLRVARHRAVLCCPLAPPGDGQADRELADWFEEVSGVRETYLDEHAANGLPAESDLRAIIDRAPADWEVDMRFNGDRETELELFRHAALAHYRHRPADRVRYAWSRLRTPIDDALREQPGPRANRVYLVCRRTVT
jgi:SAM-dependent methyltransferase